jgi:diguanylate cyclase (GGDEF)-like protein
LKCAAQAVRRVLRNTDSVGRFGGDEFLIIQQFVRDRGDVETLIDRIFEELKTPFIINDKEIQIKLSIGVSMFPDNTTDFETLINQADSAMYEAKKREGCTLSYFEPQASGFSGLNALKNLPEVFDMVDS